MTEIDELFDRINKKTEEIFVRFPEEYDKTIEWLDKYRDELISKINLVQSGAYNVSVPVLPKTPSRNKRGKRAANHLSSSDEEPNTTNSENLSTDITDSSLSSKPKRNASKIAEQKINFQSSLTLKSKMRRPGNTVESALHDISNTTIKKEKQSLEKLPVASQINIKTEPEEVKSENMPPPANIPKRGKKKIKKEVESSDTENESNRVTRSKRVVKSTTTRSVRGSKTSKNNRKDSDVILQEVPVPIVIINDSDPEESSKQILLETQNNNENSKKEQDTAHESDDNASSTSRTTKKKKEKGESKNKKTEMKTKVVETVEMQEESLYEDALPIISKDEEATKITNNKVNEPVKLKECTVTLENMLNNKEVVKTGTENICLNSTRIIEKPNLNDTHVISNKPEIKTTNAMNCTVVLHKLNETVALTNNEISNKTVILTPKDNLWKKAAEPPSVENILTDDEDSIVKATPEKNSKPARKGTKTKQMFSPYANSPVRKRVAAFEKLVANEETKMPTRTTRTKTRNMEKEKENMLQNNTDVKNSAKSKYFTPVTVNKLPSLIPQSDSKAYRQGTIGSKQNSSVMPIKSASAAKPTRAELQVRREEEQKKRLEKEEEAKKKREAIMQAKAEEQRKKREEKQMKAQKAREEMEREKEEKLRQMLQEKEEEQQKKREWQAKKFAEIEERKKAEAAQLKLLKLREQEKLMKQMEEEKRKKKLASKPPPLPTDDCEDSDSSSESNSKKHVYHKPIWAQSIHLNRTLLIQRCLPKNNIELLFNMEATTPDLLEIFETVDERILRRNSSAVWRTPPKYSTLTKL